MPSGVQVRQLYRQILRLGASYKCVNCYFQMENVTHACANSGTTILENTPFELRREILGHPEQKLHLCQRELVGCTQMLRGTKPKQRTNMVRDCDTMVWLMLF